ncbi:hypothetical protein GALMADRAFT_238869 [Galerina marginata CBS 339.88]|uniref:P-loop containing nucleoside triphosphate hydrolase protein n=1 Tax=Galerina marginata (strain CBS 339.88) TaxID=685588 RepID=A0A067TT32_GALM3|nr:hypothetical protein GALMADRAFT_238869 [Galerina marginata CBS 339.88]
MLPAGIACLLISCHLLFAVFFRRSENLKNNNGPSISNDAPRSRLQARLNNNAEHSSGYAIMGFMITRVFGTVTLLCLSAITSKNDCKITLGGWTHTVYCPESSMTIVYLYTSILSAISVSSVKWGHLITVHNTLVLLSAWAVYVYRDLWPLATYTQVPADLAEGNILWAKIAVLTASAVVIPLFVPRVYEPVDPKNPMPTPNPEQTASWISRFTYTYIDSIVFLGYKVPHLRHDQLPPLADDDSAKYQTSKAFPHLDPFSGPKRRHIFFGLMYHFREDYVIMAISIILAGLSSFVAPAGIKQTLNYLETRGENATVRPWFWVAFLLFGPLLQSIFEHWMLFTATRVRVRLGALLTQLVFEHSLRTRVTAEISSKQVPDKSNAGTVQAKPATNNQLGLITNLITTDFANILGGLDFLNFFLQIPLQVTLSMIFLYQVLGWSAVVGLATILIFIPVPGILARKLQAAQKVKMKRTDARVQTISEAVSILRMIKLFGWENKMKRRLDEKREDELQHLWKIMILKLTNGSLNALIPMTTTLVTYITYTAVMGEELNGVFSPLRKNLLTSPVASKIFSSMAVFSILRTQIHRVSWRLPLIIQGKVSLDRFTAFLHDTELLDSFMESKVLVQTLQNETQSSEVGFRDATFAWSIEDDGSATPSSRRFRLNIEGELLFRRNCINLIVGPTGSGKTSILMALLGEMHFLPTTPESWFNLPRENGVAYAAQDSWVQSATIRENILFGSSYDEVRYQKVISQCALRPDLELFDAGDLTEVGERGLTLSGGQKARVTLARAIYSSAQIILLDDVLAALDVHTSAWIMDQCFRGDLVKGRTILFVTHNLALLAPVAEFVVSIGVDGRIKSQATEIATALARDPILASEAAKDKEDVKDAVLPRRSGADGKLVVSEEIVQGHVTWKSMRLLLSALGGNRPVLFFAMWLLVVTMSQWVATLQLWFLGVWGSQYELHPPSEVRLYFYLSIFVSIAVGNILLSFFTTFYYNRGVLRSARSIHTQLIDSVFRATLRWLDETPTARIIARCTQDISAIDGAVPQSLKEFVDEFIAMLTKLGAVVLFTPAFLLPGAGVAVLGMSLGNLYLKSQLSVKREMSNARSPLLAHFSAAIQGLISIRAYGAQEAFRDESLKRIDFYSRAARTSWNLNRWIGLRIDALGASFTAALATYLIYGTSVSAANTGFSLNNSLAFCTYLFFLIRTINELEVQSNSLERIQGYIDIEHEPKPTAAGYPPAAWPASGDLWVENLSARYSQSGPQILHNISFNLATGEHIGVVGRTGSGKSSLTLALLRCILTEGRVFYDGIATNTINLDALRSSITIIPQTPELLSGTLRQNLDPFEQNDDATLNDALRSAGLFSLQDEGGDARFTLDTKIAGGGSNLSVGERQILALARAMIRGSKLLILDEATSAIDYKTDVIIQNTLRNQLGADVTVITVAHRLQTIMDADKIMVLDNGRIVEFDTPRNLLKDDRGFLRALVDGSAERTALRALAGAED